MKPEHFELVGLRGYFRPQGKFTYEEFVRMIDAALRYCSEQALREMVLNLVGVTGFAPPALPERYVLIRGWARILGGKVRLVVVAPPELIDPSRFGVDVAHNRGLQGDVFTSEAEAVAWLDADGASPRR